MANKKNFTVPYEGTFEEFLLDGAVEKLRWQFDRSLHPPDENGCIYWKGTQTIGDADKSVPRRVIIYNHQINAQKLAWWLKHRDDILDAENIKTGQAAFHPMACEGYCLNPDHMERIYYAYGQDVSLRAKYVH